MLDESYIQISLELAKKGIGNVSPNPLIGSLIVKNDKIIGAGFEGNGFGNSIARAIENAKESVDGSSLYINMEPCISSVSDSESIAEVIKRKVKRVIIGCVHPDPKCSGRAIKQLKDTGIEVKYGVLERDCVELNRFFLKHRSTGFPYITVKISQTLDGKISDVSGNSKWISSVESRSYVHELRSEYDAVLVGKGTVKKDNPGLTVRLVEGRNPKRVVLDSDLSLGMNYNLFKKNDDLNLIVITAKESKEKKKKVEKLLSKGVEIIFVKRNSDNKIDLKSAMKKLAARNIISLLIEGGSQVFTSFVHEKLFDELLIFNCPKILGSGVEAISNLDINSLRNAYQLNIKSVEKIGEDALIRIVNR